MTVRTILRLSITLSVMLFAASVSAQDEPPPITWGTIPGEHLSMTAFPSDPEASAVILCDYGEVTFDRDDDIRFSRHVRIKILNKAGFEWGTGAVRLYTGENGERLEDLEGKTYSLDNSGKTVEATLDRSATFEEQVSENFRQVRFTLPALKAGAVIEYRYTKRIKSLILMPDWNFQDSEPTLWSEFRTSIPYRYNYIGMTQRKQNFYIEHGGTYRNVTGSGRYARLVMKDVPALRDEPFITTTDDHVAKVRLQLSSIVSGGFERPYLSSWEEILKRLSESKYYSLILSSRGDLEEKARQLTAGVTEPQKKMRLLCTHLQKSLRWNGAYRIGISDNLSSIYAAKTGSSGDLNYTLACMLRAVDIDAKMVLTGTRDHGNIFKEYALIDQFNTVVVLAKIGTESVVLDITNENRPADVLPPALSGCLGLVVQSGTPVWITLTPDCKYERAIASLFTLTDDGAFKGAVRVKDAGYSAVRVRGQLADKEKAAAYPKSFFKADANAAVVDSFHIQQPDSLNAAVVTILSISKSSDGQSQPEFIYLNPHLIGRTAENPFKKPSRLLPISFPYLTSERNTISVQIPNGYKVSEQPKSISLKTPDGGLTYTRQVGVSDNMIQISIRHDLNQFSFLPEQYQDVRALYERMVELESEMLVLQKDKPQTDATKTSTKPVSVPKPNRKK